MTFGAKILEIFVLMIRQFHKNESSWNVRCRGTKVPRKLMFHWTKVLGTFAPEEWKFHKSESSKEQMFHGTKVPREWKFSLWSFCSRERKCRGTKRPGIRSFRQKMSQSDVWKPICLHSGSSLQQWQHICLHHSFLLKYNNNKNKYTRTCKWPDKILGKSARCDVVKCEVPVRGRLWLVGG